MKIISIILCALTLAVGCTNAPPMETSTFPPPSQTGFPVQVASVENPTKPGDTINPGGPPIEITLKNISHENIVSLTLRLFPARGGIFGYDYKISQSNPFLPNKLISSRTFIIGGDFNPYYLEISGILQSGNSFSFRWEPPDVYSQYPPVGSVLSIEPVKGDGNGWLNGIEISNAKFTFGYLETDIVGIPKTYKTGSPVIYFNGTLVNTSAQDWEVRLSTVETTTLDYCGIWGGTCVFIKAGSSVFFRVRLDYKTDLTKITINIQVSTMPFP